MASQDDPDASAEAELPDRFCRNCESVCFEGEPSCPECGRARPAEGWSLIGESYDPFLGCLIDDRYLVEKREARGATTSVYRARIVEDDRRVALKIAHSMGGGEVDDYVRERMSREVAAVGRLESSHIVPIFEFHELDGGPAVIVMDYVDGVTLDEVVRGSGPPAIDRTLEIATQTARGLAEAHRQQLIHRDIKPSNIMLEETEDGGEDAYLLDFGIVRVHEAASGLTREFIGTPLYTSPEQARLDNIGFQTDIYSLGATLFFALTGRPPFVQDDVDDVMRAHAEEEPPTIGDVAPERAFPQGLEELVDAMLSKFPGERPDADAVLERLIALEISSDIETEDGGEVAAPGEPRRDSPDRAPNPGNTLIYEPDSETDSSTSVSAVSSGEHHSLRERTDRPPDQGRRLSPESSISFLAETDQGNEFASKPRTGSRKTLSSLASLSESTDIESGITGLNCLAASVDGDVVVADEDDVVWLLETGGEEATALFECDASIREIALGRDLVWAADARGRCIRIDRSERRVLEVLGLPEDLGVTAMSATMAGETLAIGFDDGSLYRGTIRDFGRERLEAGSSWVVATTIRGECESCCVAEASGRIWILTDGVDRSSEPALSLEESPRHIDLSSDGELVGVATESGEVGVHHSAIGRPVTEVRKLGVSPKAIFFTQDDHLRAVADRDGDLLLWDCVADRELARYADREQVSSGRR